MDAQDAYEEIGRLVRDGKKLSEIIAENPELVPGLDIWNQKLLESNLRVNTTAVVKREVKHNAGSGKKSATKATKDKAKK